MVGGKKLTRRDFVRLSAGSTAALGVALFNFPDFEKLFLAAVNEVPVIWIQGGACSGCSVSTLNSLSPKIQEALVGQVIPGQHLSLRYHPTVMAAQGELALQALDNTATNPKGYLLVVEGTIPTKDDGVYCTVGEKNGQDITILELLIRLAPGATAVLALGACTCANHGGIPGCAPNVTGCKEVKNVLAENDIQTRVINLPGCPPHPDWVIGTIASILIGGLGSVEVDDQGRPLAFYGKLVHDQCQRRSYYDGGIFAKKHSEPYCLYELGCKGPVTHADCPIRQWNSGTNWCVGSGGMCIGCASLGFPDEVSPLEEKVQPFAGLNLARYVPGGLSVPTAAGAGVITGLALGAAGAVAATKLTRRGGEKKQQTIGKEK